MNKRLKLDLNRLLDEANGEVELLSYFIKLVLKDYNIPIKMNINNISWQPFEVESGELDWKINLDNMTMDIEYARA